MVRLFKNLNIANSALLPMPATQRIVQIIIVIIAILPMTMAIRYENFDEFIYLFIYLFKKILFEMDNNSTLLPNCNGLIGYSCNLVRVGNMPIVSKI